MQVRHIIACSTVFIIATFFIFLLLGSFCCILEQPCFETFSYGSISQIDVCTGHDPHLLIHRFQAPSVTTRLFISSVLGFFSMLIVFRYGHHHAE